MQAQDVWQAELNRYQAVPDKDLIARASKISNLSQATAFEVQLVRTFKKKASEHTAGVKKYMAIYANVPPSSVLHSLWNKAQSLI